MQMTNENAESVAQVTNPLAGRVDVIGRGSMGQALAAALAKLVATRIDEGVASMLPSSSRLLAALSLLWPALTLAQTPPAPPPPGCPAEVRRQFDFWVGDWSVTEKGQHAGDNRIDKILDGCALLENWTGAGGMSGKSLNFYIPASQQWHQTWIDDRGGSLELDGKFADGHMVLSGSKKDKASKTTLNRITWTALPSGQVRQVWETSNDGKAWTVAFDGLYTRKK